MEFECTCKICGKKFSASQRNRCYCSEECKREKERRRMNLRRAVEHPEMECPVCGTKFIRKNGNQLYCSSRCTDKASRERLKAEKKAREPEYGERVCVVCGKPFKLINGRKKTCKSIKCAAVAARAKRMGRTIEEQIAHEAQKQVEVAVQKERPLSPLAKMAREARAAGLSYGQYVAKNETPRRELERAKKMARYEENENKRRELEARAEQLAHDLEIVRRTV